jgi:hypothetical protein
MSHEERVERFLCLEVRASVLEKDEIESAIPYRALPGPVRVVHFAIRLE